MSANDADDSGDLWQSEQRVFEDAHSFVARRAVIDQAKGMLMMVHGIDADEAFDALRSHSQEHNVKLRLLAEQIVKDLVELARTKGPTPTPGVDTLILGARERIANAAARQLDGESKTGIPMKDIGADVTVRP